jgi:hypothetical protein
MSKPIEVLSSTYSQLSGGNDTTMSRATYVRITNIATTTAYDIYVRTVANSGNPDHIVGRTIIAPNETFILKKDPDHFVGSVTTNIYASAVSPNP